MNWHVVRNMTPALLLGVLGAWNCAVAAGAADLRVLGNLEITSATTFTSVTNRYEGLENAIRDDLTLTGRTYVRLLGSTKTDSTLALGPADAVAANLNPVVTIEGASGFYASYRNSSGWLGETDTSTVKSRITCEVGANGGAGMFVVKSVGSGFGAQISDMGLFIETLRIHENATSAGDYIDVLRLDAGGVADVTRTINANAKPARILFNGGRMRKNYVNSAGAPFEPAAGCVQVVEGINGNNVDIYKTFHSNYLNGGPGTLRFQGDCNVRLSESGANLPGVGNQNRGAWQLTNTKGPIEWLQRGDIIFYGNARVTCESDDRFPYAANTPILRLQGNAILDLNGTSQKLRSLISESTQASVTNVMANYEHRTVTSKLVFGTGDTDGVFSAISCDNVDVEKVGTGTLVVSNVTMAGTLTISAGHVKFVGVNKIAHIVLSDAAQVDGGLDEGTTDSIKHFVWPEGATPLTYEKTDDTTQLVYAGAQLTGASLDVKGGTLRFTGGSNDKWWRLTMLKAVNMTASTCKPGSRIEINEFSLYGSNVVTHPNKGSSGMLNTGLKTNETGMAWTSYDQMPPGTCTEGFGETYTWNLPASGRRWFGVDALCSGSGADVYSTAVSESAPHHIYYRLADNAPAVSSYLISLTQWSPGSALQKWELHSSADGVNWTLRDAHEAQWVDSSHCQTMEEMRATTEIPYGTTDPIKIGTAGYYNNGVPYRFTSGGTADETLRDIRVAVAEGATLDTRYVADDQQSIAELRVDGVAGGGTITKFVPAANGMLRLTNATLARGWRVPITLESMAATENLASWRVSVDGTVRKGWSVVARNGSLYVTRLGVALILR